MYYTKLDENEKFSLVNSVNPITLGLLIILMKTIGTKLDNDEFEEFLEICNEEGCSKSELLRKFVKDSIRERTEIIETEEVKPVAQGTITKISYDGGKTWVDVAEIENPKIVES